MVKIEHLTFSYRRKQTPVLDDFTLEIAGGGIYGLLGKNGTGKSTLLYLISGLLTPNKGEVMIDGVNSRKRLPSTLEKIFIVPEEFDLPSLPLSRYVEINAPFYPNFSADDLKRHLQTMGMSADINLGQLSMGQKKKAFMCFALACNTPLLLMDEPTNGLDIPSKSAFRRFIASAVDESRTVVISTHQVKDIEHLLDHVILIDNHQVLLNSSVAEITRRLYFGVTDNAAEAAEARFGRKSLGGFEIITDNPYGEDSDINLELLFDFALTDNERLHNLFANPLKPSTDE